MLPLTFDPVRARVTPLTTKGAARVPVKGSPVLLVFVERLEMVRTEIEVPAGIVNVAGGGGGGGGGAGSGTGADTGGAADAILSEPASPGWGAAAVVGVLLAAVPEGGGGGAGWGEPCVADGGVCEVLSAFLEQEETMQSAEATAMAEPQ